MEEYRQFESDVTFTDRGGRLRCFYITAICRFFWSPAELMAQVLGEPDIILLIRDTKQPFTGHDFSILNAEIRKQAGDQYRRLMMKDIKVYA